MARPCRDCDWQRDLIFQDQDSKYSDCFLFCAQTEDIKVTKLGNRLLNLRPGLRPGLRSGLRPGLRLRLSLNVKINWTKRILCFIASRFAARLFLRLTDTHTQIQFKFFEVVFSPPSSPYVVEWKFNMKYFNWNIISSLVLKRKHLRKSLGEPLYKIHWFPTV